MYLGSEQGFVIPTDINFLVGVGVLFFFAIGFLALFYFFWVVRSSMKNFHSFVILVALALSIPITVVTALSRHEMFLNAFGVVRIESLEVYYEANKVIINFETPQDRIAYLEYKDNRDNRVRSIVPPRFEAKKIHSFEIDDISEKGGEVVFIIDGKRYLVDGLPLILKP